MDLRMFMNNKNQNGVCVYGGWTDLRTHRPWAFQLWLLLHFKNLEIIAEMWENPRSPLYDIALIFSPEREWTEIIRLIANEKEIHCQPQVEVDS